VFRVGVSCFGSLLYCVLYAILMTVSLNRFVIVLPFALWYVKVAPFLLFYLVLGSCRFVCVCVFSFVVKCRGIDCYRL
jgi:hypothetical protein